MWNGIQDIHYRDQIDYEMPETAQGVSLAVRRHDDWIEVSGRMGQKVQVVQAGFEEAEELKWCG